MWDFGPRSEVKWFEKLSGDARTELGNIGCVVSVLEYVHRFRYRKNKWSMRLQYF